MLSHFHNFAKSQNFLIGASLVRISIALLLLYHYLIHYFQRYFLWSDSGVNVYEPKEAAFSLYNFNNSLAYFDLIYHLGIIVTIIYLLGYKGRIISIINYIFYFSLYNRTVHISDGGDNLLIICMLFLLFANTTAYFSLDAKKHQERLKANKTSFFKDISMIFHNFAVLACIIQLCVVYFFSGIFQVMGEVWQNGTAIYYISQVSEFSRSILQNLTENYLWVTIVISYLSILIKLAFPFCLLNKAIKPYIVLSMILFHVGIGIGMGLLSFSLVMIMFELLVFTDSEYLRFKHKFKYQYRKIATNVKRKTRSFGTKHLVKYQILVFFDGWCPMCRQVMKTINKMDLFNLVKSASIRNQKVLNENQLVKEEVEIRMHSKSVIEGEMKRGFDSILQICTRLVPLYVLIPFLLVGKFLRLGDLIYDYIAKRRLIVPVNHCDDSGCDINIQSKS